ncbi:MAG: hypothetical protein ACFWUM_02000 [Eubacteriales bacterium]|jgi:uncharacterized protein YutD
MDVKVRGADPAAVKKIDELARRQNISRNLFLVNLINNYAALEEFQNFEQRYAEALEQCLNVIRQNSIVLQKVLNIVGEWGAERKYICRIKFAVLQISGT